MNIKDIRTCLLMGSLIVIRQPHHGLAQQNSDASAISAQGGSMERDRQHDFDFEIGSWNREIAGALYLSEGRVKNHVSNILSKLGVRDRTRAVLKAIERGIV